MKIPDYIKIRRTIKNKSRTLFIYLFVLLIFITGCGGSNDTKNSEDPHSPGGSAPLDPNDPQSANPDATPTPSGLIPTPSGPIPPHPTSTPISGSASRDITRNTETEHYGTDISVPSLGLSFGLLESSGGSYELEPSL